MDNVYTYDVQTFIAEYRLKPYQLSMYDGIDGECQELITYDVYKDALAKFHEREKLSRWYETENNTTIVETVMMFQSEYTIDNEFVESIGNPVVAKLQCFSLQDKDLKVIGYCQTQEEIELMLSKAVRENKVSTEECYTVCDIEGKRTQCVFDNGCLKIKE